MADVSAAAGSTAEPNAEKSTFRPVFAVGYLAAEAAREVEAHFQHAIAPATVDFDFGEISRAAAAIPGATTVKIVRGWGLQETAPVNVMVLSLREAVRQSLPEGQGGDALFWERAEAALADVFTGLAGERGTHLSFYEEEPDRTSYYYDLLFALDEDRGGAEAAGDAGGPAALLAIAFCVNVSVGLGPDAVRALALGDTAHFTIRLNAITVRREPVPVPA
ncbi:Type-2Aa cytolytic delta-endotoxin [Streptomyces solincola]|uniref:Type-2Aa cytolytic delta-endotoxin n=1 Tax=Streptomyces solincola TaxID=2100817 RepID=A0A2S9PWU3_9ACTN|nr:Type-2Aa cytolytic delta-endotoxin [Streptomyces solincola]PRH78823.1 Type-2Aa cytolytic delta-endotoxin [Streptomyces solincola]